MPTSKVLPWLAPPGREAQHLRALPNILVASGLPEVTMNHPQIAVRDLDRRLAEWGLR